MDKKEPAKSFQDLVVWQKAHQGSLEESRYCLIQSKDLGYGDSTPLLRNADDVARLLAAYIRGLQ